jgi:hypothetical protein
VWCLPGASRLLVPPGEDLWRVLPEMRRLGGPVNGAHLLVSGSGGGAADGMSEAAPTGQSTRLDWTR